MNRFRTVDLRKSQIYGGRHCNLCVYYGYKYTILSGCRYDVFVSPIINSNNKYTLLLFIYIMTLTWGVKVFVILWHIINVTLVNSWIVGFSIKNTRMYDVRCPPWIQHQKEMLSEWLDKWKQLFEYYRCKKYHTSP
jgi:hypothetical protein